MKVFQHYVLSVEADENIFQIAANLRSQNLEVEVYADDDTIEVYGDVASKDVTEVVDKSCILNNERRGNTVMKTTINFGKVDYRGSGRKNCQVEVDIELRDTDKGPEFSASAAIWNPRHTDCYIAGQCIDDIYEEFFKDNEQFAEIYRLHEAYHLNGMHAGTEAQEAALKKFHVQPEDGIRLFDYKADCAFLESIGLLVDNGYRYGTAWLYREIPEADLTKIKSYFQLTA